VIIVDNNPDCYTFDNANAIPIESWFDNPEDKELQKITPILESLTNTNDVWKYIKQFVEGPWINYMRALKVLSKKGYQWFIPHKHDLEWSNSPLWLESPLNKQKKLDFY